MTKDRNGAEIAPGATVRLMVPRQTYIPPEPYRMGDDFLVVSTTDFDREIVVSTGERFAAWMFEVVS